MYWMQEAQRAIQHALEYAVQGQRTEQPPVVFGWTADYHEGN